jgi:hypothetical protein
MRYTSSLAKTYAVSFSIFLTALVNLWLLGESRGAVFWFASGVVIISVILYNWPMPTAPPPTTASAPLAHSTSQNDMRLSILNNTSGGPSSTTTASTSPTSSSLTLPNSSPSQTLAERRREVELALQRAVAEDNEEDIAERVVSPGPSSHRGHSHTIAVHAASKPGDKGA